MYPRLALNSLCTKDDLVLLVSLTNFLSAGIICMCTTPSLYSAGDPIRGLVHARQAIQQPQNHALNCNAINRNHRLTKNWLHCNHKKGLSKK